MTVVALIFVPVVIAYQLWVYRIFRGEMGSGVYGEVETKPAAPGKLKPGRRSPGRTVSVRPGAPDLGRQEAAFDIGAHLDEARRRGRERYGFFRQERAHRGVE